MTDLSSIGHPFAPAQPPAGHAAPIGRAGDRVAGRIGASGDPGPVADRRDTIELSGPARFLDRMRQMPEIRRDLVNRMRAQIDAGTYETPEKLATAINRMIDDVAAEA